LRRVSYSLRDRLDRMSWSLLLELLRIVSV